MNGRDEKGFRRGLKNQLTSEIDSYSGEDGNQHAAVFWTGIVMDDKDELSMARVWVFLPGYNTTGPVETQFPSWQGTVPDKRGVPGTQFNSALRQNWILCWPNGSYFGSDELRADSTNDGRNSYSGDTNSYGDFVQPRIGDHVSVILMNGDPSLAYWTGCIPKLNQNNMVPGLAGTPRNQIDTGPIVQGTAAGAMLHGYDNKQIPELPGDSTDPSTSAVISSAVPVAPGSILTAAQNPVASLTSIGSGLVGSATGLAVPNPSGTAQASATPNRFPANTATRNSVVGGHAYDNQRGPGSTSSRRESPSYVTGRKSAGWNYDTEQFNANALGTGRFMDSPSQYQYVNTAGHQWMMDDHPDSQLVRTRTSAGSQILMCDSGTSPFIYLCTAKGNAWIELSDDGNIHIYAEDSISLHAKNDVNITGDRSINLETMQLNLFAHDTMRFTSGADTMMSINGALSLSVLQGMNHYVQGGFSQTVRGPYGLTVLGDLAIKATTWSDCITGTHISDVTGPRYQMGGSLQSIQAKSIWLNSGLMAAHKEPAQTKLPKFPELTKKSGPPTPADVQQNQRADKDKYLAGKVPQHQPWPGRTGQNTAQTNGQIGPTPTQVDGSPSTTDGGLSGPIGSIDPTSAAANVRNGAALPAATVPDTIIGPCSISLPPIQTSFNYVSMTYGDTLGYLGISN